jgi:hypothetical protein
MWLPIKLAHVIAVRYVLNNHVENNALVQKTGLFFSNKIQLVCMKERQAVQTATDYSRGYVVYRYVQSTVFIGR